MCSFVNKELKYTLYFLTVIIKYYELFQVSKYFLSYSYMYYTSILKIYTQTYSILKCKYLNIFFKFCSLKLYSILIFKTLFVGFFLTYIIIKDFFYLLFVITRRCLYYNYRKRKAYLTFKNILSWYRKGVLNTC